MSDNKVVSSHTEHSELGCMELANAVVRMQQMIPSLYLGNATLPMTTGLYKRMDNTQKTFKHIIDLSLMEPADVKLVLEHYHDLDDTGKRTLTLFMRLIERDEPAMFEKYKQWFPEKTIFDSVNIVKTERSLLSWDKETMPYLDDWDLKAICIQFSDLNSDHRHLLIEYINLFVALCPAETYKIKSYLERKDPEHPLLFITALSKRELCSNRVLRNKLVSWDVSTVPYFSEDTLKDLAIHYDRWLIEERKCFFKYVTMLNEVCPEQVHRLKEHLERTHSLNSLLKLGPLASSKNKTNPNGRKRSKGDNMETGKNELMDIGDSNLDKSHVKNGRFGANATVPQNKIKLNLIKSNRKNVKSKKDNFNAKFTPQCIDAVIVEETNQSIIDLETSDANTDTFNEYLSFEQNDLHIYNDSNQCNQAFDMKPDYTNNNFTLADFL